MTEEHDTPPQPAALREATPDEHELITRLATSLGHRLLRDWEELPASAKALPMNRAFLSALAHAMGSFLGACAAVEPTEAWHELAVQTLQIAKQTALEQRAAVLTQTHGQAASTLRVLVPEPKSVM